MAISLASLFSTQKKFQTSSPVDTLTVKYDDIKWKSKAFSSPRHEVQININNILDADKQDIKKTVSPILSHIGDPKYKMRCNAFLARPSGKFNTPIFAEIIHKLLDCQNRDLSQPDTYVYQCNAVYRDMQGGNIFAGGIPSTFMQRPSSTHANIPNATVTANKNKWTHLSSYGLYSQIERDYMNKLLAILKNEGPHTQKLYGIEDSNFIRKVNIQNITGELEIAFLSQVFDIWKYHQKPSSGNPLDTLDFHRYPKYFAFII